eukprot:TRINITY_DN55290_c0_g1_i1.p2 TRINITY_DN55290_c0_g1~~TRINITY_DN55290_c0_g1_i1.p2  ORF type:complete len:138 (+),score=21.95 TRINITY_DN55290_c0_g1_i1:51-416(+)
MATSMKDGAMVNTVTDESMIKANQWELKWFYAKRGGMPGEVKKMPWYPLPPHQLTLTPAPSRPGSGDSQDSRCTRKSMASRRSRSSTALSAAGSLATELRATSRISKAARAPGCGRALSIL